MNQSLPPDSWEDAAYLLKEFKAGNQKAFRHIFDQHYVFYFNYCLAMIKDSNDAANIVALSFNKIWKERDQFNSLAAIQPLMTVYIRHECFKYNKAKGRLLPQSRSLTDDDNEQKETTMLMRAELLQLSINEIKLLPEADRRLLTLLYEKKLSVAEVAEILDEPELIITQRKVNALALLRAILIKKKMQETE